MGNEYLGCVTRGRQIETPRNTRHSKVGLNPYCFPSSILPSSFPSFLSLPPSFCHGGELISLARRHCAGSLSHTRSLSLPLSFQRQGTALARRSPRYSLLARALSLPSRRSRRCRRVRQRPRRPPLLQLRGRPRQLLAEILLRPKGLLSDCAKLGKYFFYNYIFFVDYFFLRLCAIVR